MLKYRPSSLRAWKLTVALIGLLTLVFACPAPLHARKKKVAPAPQGLAHLPRQTYHFDLSKIVWPSPPAIARIKFVDMFFGQKIDSSALAKKKKKKKGWMDRLAGTQTVDQVKPKDLSFQLLRPMGVGVDSKGRIYAADQGVGAIFIFDPEHKDHVELIGNGKQANFSRIVGLALDDDDRLFVSDSKLRHILVFNPQHVAEAVFGADVLVRPAGIAIDRENRFLYVADTGDDCIDVFDADTYKLLRRIGKPGKTHDQTAPGTFSLPEGVAVDSDSNVYVTDTFNDRVEVFDADGEFIRMFGRNGDGPADFERPKGIAVDRDDHIWVVDAAQNRVKVFNQRGQLLICFGEPGNYPGQFQSPWGITIDKFNRVITSETFYGRLQMFRYVTEAEAAAQKVAREAKEQKSASSSATPEQKAPAAQSSQAMADRESRNDTAAH